MATKSKDKEKKAAGKPSEIELQVSSNEYNELLCFKMLFAAARGNIEQLQAVIDKGADLNAGDYDKRTALHLAAAEGNLEVVKFLVEKNVDLNCKDRFNNTPIDDAIRHGHQNITNLLIASGATPPSSAYETQLIAASSEGDIGVVKRLLESKVNANAKDYDGRSALHLAAAGHHEDIVRLLLDAQADPNAKDRWDGNPLHDAIRSGNRIGDDAVVKMLKDAMGVTSHNATNFFTNKMMQLYLIFQFGMLILYAIFAKYDTTSAATLALARYPMFQDVHVMIFIGFGFLMTFLRKYGYGAVGLNMLISVIVIQWHPLLNTFWHNVFAGSWGYVYLNVATFINADFCAGAVLITFGALLGKTSAVQMFIIAVVEAVLYSINEQIGLKLSISDLGGSMVIHAFGAFFGLGVSWTLTPKKALGPSDNAAVYHSDLFSMIGTIFLWMFWLSFNAAFADGLLQSQAIINTLLCLCASCLTAFACSNWLRGESKFAMVDIQNATLSGGVGMGTCCNMNINPAVAIAIGMSCGFISVLGYTRIQPFLERTIGLHDTCGVLNLHGMPAILGGTYGAIAANYTTDLKPGVQFAFLVITFFNALISGIVVGFLMKQFGDVNSFFNDSEDFEVPELEKPYYFDKRGEVTHSNENAERRLLIENKAVV